MERSRTKSAAQASTQPAGASFREGEGPATRLYLAQQYVEGESLAALLQRRRFDAAEATLLARQVLAILRYLHGLSPPVVHRDVKPANLIVRPDNTLALVDFGCAREVAPRGTHRATVTGTFGFMPPEALGGTLDRTADLYGLGATLVQLLSRRPPEELLWEGEQRDLGRHVNAPPAFLAFLGRLTARERARRYQSVEEALAALDARAIGATLKTRAPGLSARIFRALDLRRFLAVAVLALCVGSVVALSGPIKAPAASQRQYGLVEARLSNPSGTLYVDGRRTGNAADITVGTRVASLGFEELTLAFDAGYPGKGLTVTPYFENASFSFSGRALRSGASFFIDESGGTFERTGPAGGSGGTLTLRYRPR